MRHDQKKRRLYDAITYYFYKQKIEKILRERKSPAFRRCHEEEQNIFIIAGSKITYVMNEIGFEENKRVKFLQKPKQTQATHDKNILNY